MENQQQVPVETSVIPTSENAAVPKVELIKALAAAIGEVESVSKANFNKFDKIQLCFD